MSIKKFVGAAFCRPLAVLAALALSAMLVVGCGDDGDDEGGGNGNNLTPAEIEEIDSRLGAGASRLVGSWRSPYEYSEGIEVYTFKSNGELCEGGFLNFGTFWLEGERCNSSWRVSGDTMYVRWDEDDEETGDIFIISGNTFIIIADGGRTLTFTRISNVAAFKNSLGTFHTQDPLLYSGITGIGIGNLMWVLSTDESENYLKFYQISFNETDYYLDESVENRVWYTIGNRLFLVGLDETCDNNWENCAYEIVETVELQYRFQTVSGERRLIITHNGQEDVWLPRDYEDYWNRRAQKSTSAQENKAKRSANGFRRSMNPRR